MNNKSTGNASTEGIINIEPVKDPDYLTIEGMRAKEFSVGIFGFLILCIIVFAIIVYKYMVSSRTPMRTGEKVLFVWIIIGLCAGVIMGVLQLLMGYVF